MKSLKAFVVLISLLMTSWGISSSAGWLVALNKAVLTSSQAKQFSDGAFAVFQAGTVETVYFGQARGDVIFEIGSVTKTFIGIVLAQMVVEGRVSADDAVSKYLPELRGTFAGQTRLAELVLHKSGLPRIPDDVPRNHNPYVNYGLDRFMAMIRVAKPFKPGLSRPYPYEYSNTGFALLGLVLAKVDGFPIERVIENRILRPLGMTDTMMAVDPSRLSRFIDGHSVGLVPTAHWDFDVFAPAGALRSTLNDMMKFTRANLAPDNSSLGRAILLSRTKSWGWDSDGVGLPFPFKNGQTGGFASSLLIHHVSGTAIVGLSNVSNEIDTAMVETLKAILLQRNRQQK